MKFEKKNSYKVNVDSNPHNLKTVDEKPSGELDADEFIAFCN